MHWCWLPPSCLQSLPRVRRNLDRSIVAMRLRTRSFRAQPRPNKVFKGRLRLSISNIIKLLQFVNNSDSLASSSLWLCAELLSMLKAIGSSSDKIQILGPLSTSQNGWTVPGIYELNNQRLPRISWYHPKIFMLFGIVLQKVLKCSLYHYLA